MNPKTPIVLAALLGAGWPAFAAGAPSASGPSPAKVTYPVKEADLATITLTAQAEQRLGIQTVPVERRSVVATRLFGGEVMLPLTANGEAGGTAMAPLLAGSLEAWLKLADAQADADGRVAQAEVELKAADLALDRARKVLEAEAGSLRSVDEARARREAAVVSVATAKARRGLLGETVTPGGSPKRLWVRVPVYVGALESLDPSAPAVVTRLSDSARSHPWTAKPVAGPRTADGAAATLDFYYELEGEDGVGELRPGERMAVRLATRAEAERLVLPWAAVLSDIHGGQWVYENTGPQTFVRRRVEVERVSAKDAILARGPMPPAKVVTDGAAELFGTEFGAGK